MEMEPNWNPPGGHAQNSAFESSNRREKGLKLAEEGRYHSWWIFRFLLTG